MFKGQIRVRVPNPHGSAISRSPVAQILRQAGTSREEWEASNSSEESEVGNGGR